MSKELFLASNIETHTPEIKLTKTPKKNISISSSHVKKSHLNDKFYRFLISFRLWLFQHPPLLKFLRGIRFLIHESPWTKTEHRFNRLIRNPKMETNDKQLFVFSETVSDRLRPLNEKSYMYGPKLQPNILALLQNRYPISIARTYRNAHLTDELLTDIAHHELIVSVVRDYFGFEPKLHSCNVSVDIPGEAVTENAYDEHFHYDIASAKSLNVFIYISDVDKFSMPHVVIKGSHHNKRLRDICNGGIKHEDAKKTYGDAITTLVGEAGTTIFENTEAFHRRGDIGSNSRIFINILYTSGNKLNYSPI